MCDKPFYIAKNQKHDEYDRGLALLFNRLFNKMSTTTCPNKLTLFKNKSVGNNSGGAIKSEGTSNQQLAVELHKLIIRKLEKRNVYASFNVYSPFGTFGEQTQQICNYRVNIVKEFDS